MKKGIIAFSILLLAASCSQSTTTEVVQDVLTGNSEMPTAEIGKGKLVYESKCVLCHKAKVIDAYTKERWAVVLPEMISKAKLNANDSDLVSQYVNWELEN